VQHGIWVQTQHLLWNQGKPWKTLIELAGRRTFRMQLTSSQQSSIKSANPNISPYSLLLYFLFCFFFFLFFSPHNKLFCFYSYLYVHMIWISNKPYKTLMERIKAFRGFNARLLARSQLHSEGPATGQLDQGFPWFSLVPEQMLSWYSNSTLHCMLPMQPSQW
jgi:hypothetical protein